MSRCRICGKGPHVGNTVSHANNKSKRRFEPNLHRQKIILDGRITHARICSTCIRSGRVVRPTVAK